MLMRRPTNIRSVAATALLDTLNPEPATSPSSIHRSTERSISLQLEDMTLERTGGAIHSDPGRERERERGRDRERETERQRQRDRHTDRQTDRQTVSK